MIRDVCFLFICLHCFQQNYTKTYKPILNKFSLCAGKGLRNKWLDFDVNPEGVFGRFGCSELGMAEV